MLLQEATKTSIFETNIANGGLQH